MKVVLYPDKRLTRRVEPFGRVGPEVAALAAEMFQTMDEHEGCGLAGPQVGVMKRILVLREPKADVRLCLVNPEIVETDGDAVMEEGCLSVPRVYADVRRATWIHVRALDEMGRPLEFEAHDFLARIIQHETDHLEGLMFFDRLDLLTREAKLREWDEVRDGLAEAIAGRE
jgi:peptide deformylase